MACLENLNKSFVENVEDYETLIQIIKDNYRVVVDFYAPWCKPCKKIMPEYEKIANDHRNGKFLKMNIENLDDEELAHLNIVKFPTFIFTKSKLTDGKIEKIRYQGSESTILREKINNYLSS